MEQQQGLRDTIIGCFANGLVLNFLPAMLLPLLGSLGFANTTFGDSDFVLNGIVIGNLAKYFSKVGVYGLLVVLLVTFIGITLKSKSKNASKQVSI